ncbi:SRPBCC family protein [Streptomyces sp. SP17KL33]|uniref:SRPBCC family protein n=1 Tax=Streptomyces sp. SP17KL33 TaxID=3002534 RepID=UPI002E7A27C9|nr:SRPBCC family protein [Streptomyces sp. SP17KL33]MEE1829985.1 SRPBCC family protein [Streptomyces sp. SP17KL33]
MTETLGTATGRATGEVADRAKDATKSNPLSDLAHSEAVDHLKAEAREYVAAQAQRLLVGAGRKLGETTGKLNDIADGNSPGFAKLALDGGRKLAEGKGPLRSALEMGAGRAKDKVVSAFKNLGGGKGKRKGSSGNKPTVIIESIDVGVPVRTAYDQWTQYQSFSTFAKGVKSANRADDTHSDWQMKIFWSSRGWKAQTTEQVPDQRITWTSEGAKGTTKGAVTFHSLADDLTRVLLVIEYYPQGFFEKTGNIWRAQGRRARLDLKNFARFITLKGEAEDGWRGEIRDGEVVVSHEDAVAEEEREDEEQEELPEGEASEDGEAEGEYEEDEDADEAEPDEEPRDSDEADEAEGADEDEEEAEGYVDEDEEGDLEDPDEVPEGEYEDVPEAEDDAGEDIDEEPYEDEDEERAAAGGSRR